jgi:hypothetical protein
MPNRTSGRVQGRCVDCQQPKRRNSGIAVILCTRLVETLDVVGVQRHGSPTFDSALVGTDEWLPWFRKSNIVLVQLVLVQREGVGPFNHGPDAAKERFSVIIVSFNCWVFQLDKQAGLWLARSNL